jgi:hypothetical protein
MWRIIRIIAACWIFAGITLLYFVALDGIAALWLAYRSAAPIPAIRGLSEQCVRETDDVIGNSGIGASWYPYVYWRTAPYSGECVNIDNDGIRRTWTAPQAGNAGRRLRIFMFGGSTLWGWQIADDYTIPSLLARDLASKGIGNIEVTNFGQLGYVSSQEMIALLLELRSGNIPDLVIFYDGINDSGSALASGVPGITINEEHRVEEFKAFHGDVRTMFKYRLILAVRLVARSALGQVLSGLVDNLISPAFDTNATGRIRVWARADLKKEQDVGPAASLSGRVIDLYRQNCNAIAHLGEQYGFASFCYWQPSLWSKAHWSKYEGTIAEGDRLENSAAAGVFMRDVYKRIHETSARFEPGEPGRIHDLSRVLDEHSDSCFVDVVHVVNPDCNQTIASSIETDIAPVLRKLRYRNTGRAVHVVLPSVRK